MHHQPHGLGHLPGHHPGQSPPHGAPHGGHGPVQHAASDSEILAHPMSSEELMSPRERIGEMEPIESIYHYIVVYPELHRVKMGGYFSVKVGIAFALVLLNICLQVSLTMIAGQSIFRQMEAYQTSLTSNPDDDDFSLFDSVPWTEDLLAIPGLVAADDPSEACCAGDECSGRGIPCCESLEPSAKSFIQHHRSASKGRGKGAVGALTRDRPDATAFLRKGGKPAGKGKGKKESGGSGALRRSLCIDKGDRLDCSPPTYDFVDRWKELDYDGDGVWTREEAKADMANLGCKLGIHPAEVFRAVTSGARKFAKEVSSDHIGAEVLERTAVPHSYFQHWRGIVAMCAAVDRNRCTVLIEEGVFDGALKAANRSKNEPIDGIKDLETALEYCQAMLKPDGICEKSLPVMYLQYRQQVEDKCGEPTYDSGSILTNPYNQGDVMRTLKLSYPNLAKYNIAYSPVFRFFLCLILLVWYVNLLGEFGSIVHLADFAWNFPAAEDVDPLHFHYYSKSFGIAVDNCIRRMRGQDLASPLDTVPKRPRKPNPDAETFHDITGVHRITCFAVILVRLWLLLYMANVGSVFTLSTYSYPDLLMNAVALAFVFELPEFLFCLLVRAEDQRDLEDVGTLKYRTSIPDLKGFWGHLFSVYLWGIVIFPLITMVVVHRHHSDVVVPIYEALNCACAQAGDRCAAGRRLTKEWWDVQWSTVH